MEEKAYIQEFMNINAESESDTESKAEINN